MNGDLFAGLPPAPPSTTRLGPGTVLLRGRAASLAEHIARQLPVLLAQAPFRQMQTPGGYRMSVAMSNCGPYGWVTDRHGYRYATTDPESGRPWPALPPEWRALAIDAAAEAGFPDFRPDACLINRYLPGAKMALHQDKDERDLGAPIVSVSLGLPATFLLGGLQRGAPTERILLEHGDVLVWGGPDRLRFHGVAALKPGHQALFGEQRINLTLRQAA